MFKITYDTHRMPGHPAPEETVDAQAYQDTPDGVWIDFTKPRGGQSDRVLRVRADHVVRVERADA